MYKYIRIYTYNYMYISISSYTYTYTYRYIHIHINIYIHTSSTATTTMTHPHIHRVGGGTRNQRKSAASETSRAPPQPHNHRGGGTMTHPQGGGGGGGRRCTIYILAPVTPLNLWAQISWDFFPPVDQPALPLDQRIGAFRMPRWRNKPHHGSWWVTPQFGCFFLGGDDCLEVGGTLYNWQEIYICGTYVFP